jgi:hypothetical protein
MRSKILLGVFAVCLVAGASRAAIAQDKKVIKKIEDANRSAMEAYDILDFEAAKKYLNGALVDIKRGGLDKHPVAAKTHGNLGIVYFGIPDTDNALLEFISALEIDPKWTIPKEYKTAEMMKLFDSAKSTVGGSGGGDGGRGGSGGGSGGDGGDGSEVEDDISGLKHALVEESSEGKTILVSAKVGSDLKAKQVVLYYRPEGQEQFTAAPMRKKTNVTWEGSIPAKSTAADSVQYYIEVKAEGGKLMASNGSAGSPNIIEIARTGGSGGSAIDDENPLGGGGDDGGGDDDGGGSDGVITAPGGGPKKKTVFVNVVVGSGAGYVTGSTEQESQPVTCCVASAPLHVMPELGFFLSPRLILSAYARIGFPVGANIGGHATAAPAGALRVSYLLSNAGEGLALHGDVGAGVIRHVIKLDKPAADGGDTDTYATGPLLLGAGAAWSKTLGGPLRFIADLNLLAGVPVTSDFAGTKVHFALHMDFSAGVQLAF